MDVIELDISECSDNGNQRCWDSLPIARAYVPFQNSSKTYPLVEGLNRGTVFPELNRPYQMIDKNYRPKRSC